MEFPADQIREGFSRAPRPIREFIAEGGLAQTCESIGKSYNLHVDSIGKLSHLMTLVLLGFVNPSILPKELIETIHIDQPEVSNFIKEINQAIFIPLQARVRESINEPSHEERVQSDEVVIVGNTENKNIGIKVAAPSLVPTNSPGTHQVKQDATPVFNLAREDALVAQPAGVQHEVRTMGSDIQQLKLQESHSASMKQGYATPSRSFQTASIPVPAHLFEKISPTLQSPTTSTNSSIVKQNRSEISNGQYSSDPYREPI